MSNLEHLIENTLTAMSKESLAYVEIVNRIKADENYTGYNLSAEEIADICVYVKYTWCDELERKCAVLRDGLIKEQSQTAYWKRLSGQMIEAISEAMEI